MKRELINIRQKVKTKFVRHYKELFVQAVSVTCAIVLSLMLAACDAIPGLGGGAEEAARIEKYNSYIELSNFATGQWFEGVLWMYFSEFGYEETPETENVDFTNGFLFGSNDDEIDMFEMHGKRFELPRKLAGANPSFGPADDKAVDLIDAAESLMRYYFQDVNSYYGGTEYKTDKFAKSGELHTGMLERYSDFLEAVYSFNIAFEPVVLEFEGQDLAVFEENGMDIHFYMLRTLLTARQISGMFYVLDSHGIDFLDADISEYEPLYELLVSDIASLASIYTDKGRQEAEGITPAQANRIMFFVTTAQQLETAATDTLNMIRAGTEKVENENTGKVTTGGRNLPMTRFDQRLETLIGYYNQSIS